VDSRKRRNLLRAGTEETTEYGIIDRVVVRSSAPFRSTNCCQHSSCGRRLY